MPATKVKANQRQADGVMQQRLETLVHQLKLLPVVTQAGLLFMRVHVLAKQQNETNTWLS